MPRPAASIVRAAVEPEVVQSLLNKMEDGNEYGSIVGASLPPGTNVGSEVVRALGEIAVIRGRPCIAYVGNVVKSGAESGIDATDDLPFAEMVGRVPAHQRSVDIFLSTLGGSGQQVVRFVDALRGRFDEVDFIIPATCMSAGTLFALSGDHIWMNPRACLGPIDPQIPTKDGRFVPAQALLVLVESLREQGNQAMAAGQGVPWSAVRIIDTIDKKELGDAITATQYASTMASQFLNNYKFRHWTMRTSSQVPVDDAYRRQRAIEVGNALASHERWKSHGHSISRELLASEIRLKIDHPEAALERAIRRAWALCFWIFDKTPVHKMLMSEQYSYIKHTVATPGEAR